MNEPLKNLLYNTLYLLNSFNEFEQKSIGKTYEKFTTYEKQDYARSENLIEINEFIKAISNKSDLAEVSKLLKKQSVDTKFFIYEKLIVLSYVLKRGIQPTIYNSTDNFLEILSLSLQSSWQLILDGAYEKDISVSQVVESILIAQG